MADAFVPIVLKLKGVSPMGLVDRLEDGYYRGKIRAMRENDQKTGVWVDVGVVEGTVNQIGKVQGCYLGRPTGHEGDLSPRNWRAFFESIFGPEKSDVDTKVASLTAFNGREIYLHVRNPTAEEQAAKDAAGERAYAKVNFIRAETYQTAIAELGVNGGGVPAAPAASAAKPNGAANGEAKPAPAKKAAAKAEPPPAIPPPADDDLDALLNS